MRKAIFSLLVVVSVVFVLSSCAAPEPATTPSEPATTPSEPATTPSEPTTPEEPELAGWGPLQGLAVKPDGSSYHFALVPPWMGDDFQLCATMYGESLIARAGGTVTSYEVTFDMERQVQVMENLIVTKPDGVLITPVDTGGLAPVIDQATDSGLPVFIWDVPVESESPVSGVWFDNEQIGQVCGEWMVAEAERLGVELHVYELWGHLGQDNSTGRHDGFNQAVAQSDLVTVLESPDNTWMPEHAMQNVLDSFPTHPELNALYDHGAMVPGALEALRTMGRLHPVGDPNHVVYATIADFPSACDNIRDGYLDGLGSDSPWEMTDTGIKSMLTYVCTGQSVPKLVVIPSFFVDSEKVGQGRWGASMVWGDMVTNVPNADDWPILDNPFIETPTR